jgi:hypothetical protein
MSFVEDFSHEFEEFIIALHEGLPAVTSATLPVEDHAVRVYFLDGVHKLDGHVVLRFPFKGFGKGLQVVRIAGIDLHLSAFHGLLFYLGEEMVVANTGAEGDNNCHHLLILIFCLVVEQAN